MRLEKDATPGGSAVRVPCETCSRMFTLSEGWADLDGRAFVSYVCAECSRGPRFRDAPRSINGFPVSRLEDGEGPRPGDDSTAWARSLYALRRGRDV